MNNPQKVDSQASYAQFIASARGEAGMTQEEFARAIGTTVSTVNRWENGHRNPSRLARKAVENFLERFRAAKTPQG